jgi:hypothetical protein
MQLHRLHRQSPTTQEAPGNGAARPPMPVPGPERVDRAAPGSAARLTVTAGLLAGLWVAISPWFLTLQGRGGNATANDLIIGLAVAALAVLAVVEAGGGRGMIRLQAASALAGVWLIISPFILAAKFPITAAMYWSNVWSGAIIVMLALGTLTLARPHAAP